MLYIRKEELNNIVSIIVEDVKLAREFKYFPKQIIKEKIISDEHFENSALSEYSNCSEEEILQITSLGTQKYKIVNFKVYKNPSVNIGRLGKSSIIIYTNTIEEANNLVEKIIKDFDLDNVMIKFN